MQLKPYTKSQIFLRVCKLNLEETPCHIWSKSYITLSLTRFWNKLNNQLRILHDEMKCPGDEPDDLLLIQETSVTL